MLLKLLLQTSENLLKNLKRKFRFCLFVVFFLIDKR